jgi:hypothetical protein
VRLTETAARVAADDARGEAVAEVLRRRDGLARAHEAARVATLAAARPDPDAWRQRARLASISYSAGVPFRPGPERATQVRVVTAQRRVLREQRRLDRALARLQAADAATSLELVGAMPPPPLPRPVARLSR